MEGICLGGGGSLLDGGVVVGRLLLVLAMQRRIDRGRGRGGWRRDACRLEDWVVDVVDISLGGSPFC
jgi:hypothetical protein